MKNLTDQELLSLLARATRDCISPAKQAAAFEARREVIVNECHKRNLIGMPSKKKHRTKL